MPSPAQMLKDLDAFDWDAWNKTLAKGIEQPIHDIVIASAQAAAQMGDAVLDPGNPIIKKFIGRYAMERAKQLNGTTKDAVADIIRRAFAGAPEGATTKELANAVREKVKETYEGYEQWRADRIARTETAIGYNNGNILGFAEAGVEKVKVLDGTQDDACASANGQTWTLAESLADPIAHPNCERAFSPILSDTQRHSLLSIFDSMEAALIGAVAAELIATLDDPCADRVLEPIDD